MSKSKYHTELEKVDGVEIRIKALNNFYTNKIEYEIPVLVQILSGKLPNPKERESLNIIITLDRSGSMNGTPFEECKMAIYNLIDKLQENDTIHFIVYDDKSTIVFENENIENKEEILKKIKDVEIGGMTNIDGALESSIKLFDKYYEADGRKVMFFFSDGAATCGEKNLDIILPKLKESVKDNIYISTFGIGSNYNSKWLQSIANIGSGYHYYIDHPEKIPVFVRQSLYSYCTKIGKNGKFKINPIDSKLTEINSSRKFESLISGVTMKSIGQLDLLQFIMKFKIDSDRDEIKLFEYDFNFDVIHPSFTKESHIHGEYHIKKTDILENLLDYNPEVSCYMSIVNAGNLNLEITKLLQLGNYQKAITIKKEIIESYEKLLEHDTFGLLQKNYDMETESLEKLIDGGESAIKHHKAAARYSQGAACAYDSEEEEEDVGCAGGAGDLFGGDDDDDW
jgi:uncharacterized protein YegL